MTHHEPWWVCVVPQLFFFAIGWFSVSLPPVHRAMIWMEAGADAWGVVPATLGGAAVLASGVACAAHAAGLERTLVNVGAPGLAWGLARIFWRARIAHRAGRSTKP